MSARVTLEDHLGDTALGAVIVQVAGAGEVIARELARAALVGQHGTTGELNVQGEVVKKLDVWANLAVVDALRDSGVVCTIVSEEMEEPLHIERRCADGRYVVCIDPVDGSSNLEINGIVGTIFSVRPQTSGPEHVTADALQAGHAQVAAGYIMYGPATVMVLTTGDGVHAFTLDREQGRFIRSQAAIRMPAKGKIYSINEANAPKWEPGVRGFVDHLKTGGAGRSYTARYVGALVADFHRTLLEGGIFMYPAETKSPGKLRLQYECAPVAFLAEQAGGRGSTGRRSIMDLVPGSYHERAALLVGSADDVGMAEDFIRRG
jgi:fructose-1,6-bisphosphatase I